MELKHTVLSVNDNVATVEFENPEGLVYVRTINIPMSLNGDTTDPVFLELVEAHKRATIYKAEMGILKFRDRNAPVGPVVPTAE